MAEGNGVTTGTPAAVLTEDQKRRGQALLIGRDILAQKGGGPFASVSLTSASVYDVITLAEFILTGENPMQSELGETTDETEVNDDTQQSVKVSWSGAPAESESQVAAEDAPHPAHRGAVLFDPSFPKGYVIHGELSHAGVSNFIEDQAKGV